MLAYERAADRPPKAVGVEPLAGNSLYCSILLPPFHMRISETGLSYLATITENHPKKHYPI
jgi:hypothetical protein